MAEMYLKIILPAVLKAEDSEQLTQRLKVAEISQCLVLLLKSMKLHQPKPQTRAAALVQGLLRKE